MDEEKALNLFRAWFVAPIEMMRPNIDGGFIAFMTALALYERLIVAKLRLERKATDEETVKQRMATELHLTDKERSIFWDMFRNGLLHQAMPKTGKTGYMFHSSFTEKPDFKCYKTKQVVRIDPWKFTDWVLAQFLAEPMLIVASESFPLASVNEIDFDAFTELPCDEN